MDGHGALLLLTKAIIGCAALAGLIHHAHTLIEFLTWIVRRAKRALYRMGLAIGELYHELTTWNVDELSK